VVSGIILIILQFGPFLGHAIPDGGVIGTIQSLPDLISDIKLHEVFLAIMTLALICVFS
jgi:SulP family sulfate permease